MPSKTPLMSLLSFKLAILVPVFFACLVWGAMYRSGLPDRCWSPDCFNYAFELFKVPLAILTLIFPAVALIASHHRSVQTAAQIERADSQLVIANEQVKLVSSKNNFENYIKHKDFFEGRIEKVLDKNLKGISLNKLYNVVFTKNNSNNFDPYVTDLNDFIFGLEENFIFLMRTQKKISYINYLEFINVFFRIESIYSKYAGLKGNNKNSIVVNLKEIEEKINSYYMLFLEINLLAFPEVNINLTNGFFTKHFDEIKSFNALALDEDQAEDDSDGWGEKTYEFGYEFRNMLAREYKKNNMELEYLDELFGEFEDDEWL